MDARSSLGRPVQIAYAIRDVVDAAHRFAATTSAGPFFVKPHIPLTAARIHGVPAVFDHSSAYGQWGEVMVELVEEHSAPIVQPGSGLHHLAFLVDDTASAVNSCTREGWPEVLWAETSGGFAFAFCDARHDLGHLVELYQPTERLLHFYAMVTDAAAGWDGTDPVRLLG